MATAIETNTEHKFREDDIGVTVYLVEQISPEPRQIVGRRLEWDQDVRPGDEYSPGRTNLEELQSRRQEIEGQLEAERKWPTFRILSVLARYVIWLATNVPAATPPAGPLRDELQRLKQLLGK